MAVRMGCTNCSSNGVSGWSPNAAETAPQPLWPSTMIKETPKLATAYSMEATASSNAVLPALRTTNSWPGLTSKIQLGGTRESAQVMIPAHGA